MKCKTRYTYLKNFTPAPHCPIFDSDTNLLIKTQTRKQDTSSTICVLPVNAKQRFLFSYRIYVTIYLDTFPG